MQNTIEHYINDERVSRDDRYQDVYNPATGEVTGRVALASAGTVSEAVAAAKAAFTSWSETPPIRRARVLFRYGWSEVAMYFPGIPPSATFKLAK